MSESHGELALQKPIGEYAAYMRNLIPANMPETYALKPRFLDVANEDNIRKGVVAFRDFLYLLCDRLVSDGHLYAEPKKTRNPASYPFLHNINHLLIDIGYHGKLAEGGDSLLVTEIPVFTVAKTKIPVSKQAECLRFLTLCGFSFTGVDLEARTIQITDSQPLTVSYPDNPRLLTGLKALAIADIELRTRRYSNDDNLLRCDYRRLKSEATDALDILNDFLHPLPEEVRKFALELHQRHLNLGMTCLNLNDDAVHIFYAPVKDSKRALSTRDIYYKRVWEFALSLRYGYCLVIRAKKTDKYADVIKDFALPLQEMIQRGYGCDRKLRNERCQGGCQGFRIPLDEKVLDMRQDVETWLELEVAK